MKAVTELAARGVLSIHREQSGLHVARSGPAQEAMPSSATEPAEPAERAVKPLVVRRAPSAPQVAVPPAGSAQNTLAAVSKDILALLTLQYQDSGTVCQNYLIKHHRQITDGVSSQLILPRCSAHEARLSPCAMQLGLQPRVLFSKLEELGLTQTETTLGVQRVRLAGSFKEALARLEGTSAAPTRPSVLLLPPAGPAAGATAMRAHPAAVESPAEGPPSMVAGSGLPRVSLLGPPLRTETAHGRVVTAGSAFMAGAPAAVPAAPVALLRVAPKASDASARVAPASAAVDSSAVPAATVAVGAVNPFARAAADAVASAVRVANVARTVAVAPTSTAVAASVAVAWPGATSGAQGTQAVGEGAQLLEAWESDFIADIRRDLDRRVHELQAARAAGALVRLRDAQGERQQAEWELARARAEVQSPRCMLCAPSC
jgi:hypothetical protein